MKPRHSLVLHGQFFVDAGRRKVHDQQGLHQPTGDAHQDGMDEATLRQTWNRHLAQRVLAPMVISALDYYVRQQGLSHDECWDLTQALAVSRWFRQFRGHVCGEDAWVRGLEQDGPSWRRVRGADRDRLRPVPPPTKGDPGRPWAVFPRLEAMDVLPCDGKAPVLANCRLQWHEEELDALLGEATGLFQDGPSMDYLEAFLCDQASRFLGSQRLQARLIGLLRSALKSTDRSGRKGFAKQGKRLIDRVQPGWRLDLTADLPDRTLRELWALDAPILLVPNGLVPSPGKAVPDDPILRDWLRVLDQAVTAADADAAEILLSAIQGILKPLDTERRGRFLRVHNSLRIIAVRDPAKGLDRATSSAEVHAARESGTLFGFAQGAREQERFGLTPLLALAIPAARVWLVRAEVYRDLFPGKPTLPRADDPVACLAAVGRYNTGPLGGLAERRGLLGKANDPGTDQIARRGLRYLLHGSSEHRETDREPLWVPGHGQSPAWAKLWDQLHGEETWSRIPAELADTLPRGRWVTAGVREIDAPNLIVELDCTGRGIQSPAAFSLKEREEILASIHDEDLWRCLPLHTRVDGEPVVATQSLVYLVPNQGIPDDPLFARATLILRSQNSAVAQQQDRWLKRLDDCARIELALDTPDPATHWRPILDALERIRTPLDPSLRQRIRRVAWLPTRHGSSVKPDDVIDLPAGLGDESRRLVGEHRLAAKPCFAVPSDLADDLIGHASWTARAQDLCATGAEALGQLGLLLTGLPRYRIGTWSEMPEAKTVALLAQCPHLPGWRLLETADASFEAGTVWTRLSDGLTGTPEPQRLKETLGWLSTEDRDWPIRKAVFEDYLHWFMGLPDTTRDRLAELRLASAKKRWKGPGALCAGAHGIEPDHLLDERLAQLLGNWIYRADRGQSEAGGLPTRLPTADFYAALARTPAVLENYFTIWEGGLVPEPMIGLLLGLMGSGVRMLSQQYLGARTLAPLLEEIPWVDPGGDSIYRNWMSGRTREQLMDRLQLAVLVTDGDRIDVPPLPKATPTLWVTAPLKETGGLGFACTGPFDLDAGRARLAGDSNQNLAIAQRLGAAAGTVLAALFERGKSDWTGLRRDLSLESTLNPHDLWHGLWNCLTDRWLTGSKVGAAALARALALALLQRLTAGPGTVPNGLTGPFQAMIDLGDALYQLPKALASSEAISVLGAWERFTVKYPRQHLVSEGQGRVLKEGGMAKPVALGLTALVALVDPPKVTPEDSDALGGIRLLMEEDRDWVNDDIKKRLRALRFRTASDTWDEAARLVAGGGKGIEKDEALRYALAPDDRRLHLSYWEGEDELEARVSFFVLARERLQASTDDLVNWVLAANTTAAKQAALVYLSDGELGQAVAERVKAQDWLPVALYNQDLLAGLKHEQIQRLQGRLASAVQLQQIWQTSTSRPLLQRGLNLALYRGSPIGGPKMGPPRRGSIARNFFPQATLNLHWIPKRAVSTVRPGWLSLLWAPFRVWDEPARHSTKASSSTARARAGGRPSGTWTPRHTRSVGWT